MQNQLQICENQSKVVFIRILLISIIAITFLIYWQVQEFDFVFFDDNIYVFNNQQVKNGFSLATVKWAFTSFYAANWHPLTWLSHIMDFQLFRFNAGGHHWSNVVLHACNSLLIFCVFYRISNAPLKSGFVAAIFAVHPLHVESVAWVSERKDLLCAFFYFVAILAYTGYMKYKRISCYLLVLTCFILALLSKPMAVTLPFVLLLLDFWPLTRSSSWWSAGIFNNNVKEINICLLLTIEKIPFFILSVAACIVTIYAQHSGGAFASLDSYPLTIRIANVFQAYGFFHLLCS